MSSYTYSRSAEYVSHHRIPELNGNEVSWVGEAVPGQRARVVKWCGVRRSNFLLTLYSFFYIGFLVAGTLTFMVLEMPVEKEIRQEVNEVKQTLLKRFAEDDHCYTADELDELINSVVQAYKRGVATIGNSTMEPNWSFGQSFFFAATIVTTIGYGHVTPLSEGGKMFCIVFALIGIPLTLVLLSAFVERLTIPSTLFLQFLNSRLGHLYQPFYIKILHLVVVVIILLVFFFVIPAVIFAAIEPEWKFLDSLYYCVISLTTIGLGDYVPGDSAGQPYRLIYKICTTGYLLVGLTFMMLMLTVFYEVPQLNFGIFFLLRSDELTMDPEKMCLHNARSGARAGPKYTPHIDEPIRENIRIKPRPGDMSSPEDGRP